jgi:hypothetical protein
MTAIIVGHHVEIKVYLKIGALFVDEAAGRADILIGVDDLICGYRVGDALDGDAPTLLAVDPLTNGGVSFVRY